MSYISNNASPPQRLPKSFKSICSPLSLFHRSRAGSLRKQGDAPAQPGIGQQKSTEQELWTHVLGRTAETTPVTNEISVITAGSNNSTVAHSERTTAGTP